MSSIYCGPRKDQTDAAGSGLREVSYGGVHPRKLENYLTMAVHGETPIFVLHADASECIGASSYQQRGGERTVRL